MALALLGAVCAAQAQSRSKTRIYVPPVQGGTPEQQKFFQEQFQEEIRGAGYSVADSKDDSDYTVQLSVQPNPEYSSGGTAERYILLLQFLESQTGEEMAQFDFPFTALETMYEWNLYLLYKAVALIPDNPDAAGAAAPPPAAPEIDNRWRAKRLYLNFGLGVDLAYFMKPDTAVTTQGMVMPAVLAGVELHLLDFFSLEADPVKIRFLHDGDQYIVTPGFALLFKGVLKLSDYIMFEPYAGAEYSIPLFSEAEIPALSVLAGAQFGLRSGSREAFTLDIGVTYSMMGHLKLITGTSSGVLKFGLLLGWKIGFIDR